VVSAGLGCELGWAGLLPELGCGLILDHCNGYLGESIPDHSNGFIAASILGHYIC
jgi:hypothetical protein